MKDLRDLKYCTIHDVEPFSDLHGPASGPDNLHRNVQIEARNLASGPHQAPLRKS